MIPRRDWSRSLPGDGDGNARQPVGATPHLARRSHLAAPRRPLAAADPPLASPRSLAPRRGGGHHQLRRTGQTARRGHAPAAECKAGCLGGIRRDNRNKYAGDGGIVVGAIRARSGRGVGHRDVDHPLG